MNKQLLEYRMPAEWEPQKSVWLIWPYNQKDWPGLFNKIPEVYAKIIFELSKNQIVNLLINKNADKKKIKKYLLNYGCKILRIKFHIIKSDRVWIRDSGPIFLIRKKNKKKIILNFSFNGWSKYKNYKNDNKINNFISKKLNLKKIIPKIEKSGKFKNIVMEGGAFDVNGQGSVILTKECLLSKVQERNFNFKKKDYEKIFSKYLNIKNFIWLNKGIIGDDTHGHVDDIARFVSKNTIMTAFEKNKNDKNFKSLKKNFEILKKSRNENGNKFNIIKIPMPPPIYINKIRTPASYLNFFITNRSVLLPVFKVKGERKVINLFKKNFKNKKIVPIDCKELIWGFGAIHCMTQQEPKL